MEIEHLHDLQILELGSNRLRVCNCLPPLMFYDCFAMLLEMNMKALRFIQVMENMENLTKLEELWLGRNRIKVVNLCGLKCIKKISLQSNRLTSMKGFEVCVIVLPICSYSYHHFVKSDALKKYVARNVLLLKSYIWAIMVSQKWKAWVHWLTYGCWTCRTTSSHQLMTFRASQSISLFPLLQDWFLSFGDLFTSWLYFNL